METADICVIGAGVAGGLVAYSLAKQGHRVVILEAGPWVDKDNQRERLERVIRPDNQERVWPEGFEAKRDRASYSIPEDVWLKINQQRLKCVGGTTMHWGGEVPRMHPKDFNMQSRYGLASDWPIDYGDIQSYYADAEAELGVSGGGDDPFVPRDQSPPMGPHPPSPMDVLFEEACDDLGIRTHSHPLAINTEHYDDRSQCIGYKTCSPYCPSGARYSGDIHIKKAIEQGVRVIDEAPVQRLEDGSKGEEVQEAVYVTPDGTTHRQQADHFVLAAGAIEIPRLLLLSASSNHPNGLANNSGLVGKYLMGSSFVSVQGRLEEGVEQQPISFFTKASREFYEHEDPAPGSIRLRSGKHGPRSVTEAALGNVNRESGNSNPWGDNLLSDIRSADNYKRISLSAQIEVLPNKENSVTLSNEAEDKFGNPAPHITLNELDQHTITTAERAVEIMSNIIEEMGGKVINTGKPNAGLGGSHHKGTTRMGDDPDSSIVNEKCRTHDVNNLWIASSSVYPTGGAVNPTLTIAALSLKIGDHIDDIL